MNPSIKLKPYVLKCRGAKTQCCTEKLCLLKLGPIKSANNQLKYIYCYKIIYIKSLPKHQINAAYPPLPHPSPSDKILNKYLAISLK